MKKHKYRINLESLKNIQKSNYVLMDTFCNRNGLPVQVCISKEREPLRYLVLGELFSAYFLSYKDLSNYLRKESMHKWTQDDETNFVNKTNMSSGVLNRVC